jgi:succinoglycan biosynthesis transport protein ExoP
MQQEDPVDAAPLRPAELWAMIRRRRHVAAAAAAIFALAAFVLPSRLLPPLYRAEATLSIPRSLKPVDFRDDPTAGLVPDQLVNTQRELLASPQVLSDALAMSGLASNPAYAQSSDPLRVLDSRLRTAVLRNSWVISVTLDDEDPIRAQDGLQAVLDAFLMRQSSSTRTQSSTDLEFIATQLKEASGRLAAARDTERAFRSANAIAGVDPDRNHITSRIQILAERQADLDNRIAASDALLAQLNATDAIPDAGLRQAAYLRIETISTFTVVGALQQELYRKLGEEAELASKYLDRHPRLIEVRSHIAATRKQLDETIAAARLAIEAENRMLHEQGQALQRQQQALQRELDAYREKLVSLQALTQQTTAEQRIVDELLARQAQITALSSYADRRLVVEGAPRSSPVTREVGVLPRLVLAALSAIVGAIAATAVAEAAGGRLRDARGVAAVTGLRCLATLPCVPGLPRLAVTGAAEPAALAESVRSLQAALLHVNHGGAPVCVLLVASASAGDGRTALAVRLAAGLAMAGQRILLIDADLRHPAVHLECGLPPGPGLAELLAGEPGLAPIEGGQPNLAVMRAGGTVNSTGDLLNSHCLPEWIGLCRGQYDLVIIDSPPLEECADALLVAAHADAILLVARAGSTPRRDLAASWERLLPVRAKAVGFVLVGDLPA